MQLAAPWYSHSVAYSCKFVLRICQMSSATYAPQHANHCVWTWPAPHRMLAPTNLRIFDVQYFVARFAAVQQESVGSCSSPRFVLLNETKLKASLCSMATCIDIQLHRGCWLDDSMNQECTHIAPSAIQHGVNLKSAVRSCVLKPIESMGFVV